MAILPILSYPNPHLRKKAKPVEVFDASLAQLIEDLFETMYADEGVGLAATQADIHWRVLTVDPMENNGRQPFYLVNPEIIEREGTMVSPEGCLSVPGAYDKITRSQRIKVRAVDKHGKAFEIDESGYRAAIIQHEIDHLDGKLFIDYLSSMKRERVRKHIAELSQEKKS
ncbi:MAG: peptide deformylase [Gammaproteobacteria bacterium]|nr:peptide deformylase [Gammaproteobacteria bacterium]